MVFPPGNSRLARSTSTWIHWWSPVASANLSIISWVTVSHSDGPSWSPMCVSRSFGVSRFSIAFPPSGMAAGGRRASAVKVDQLLERHHLVAACRRRHHDQRCDTRLVPGEDAVADVAGAAEERDLGQPAI